MKKTKKPMGKGARTALNLAITAAAALVIFYVSIPALNLKNPGFYVFVFAVCAIYCILTMVSLDMHRLETGAELWKAVKKSCIVPVVICGALLVLLIVGSVIGLPIFRAQAYRELLDVQPGDFTQEIRQISYDQIPMLDKESAEKLGDRKMGELADMVSQFEVADNYTQINYRGEPVRVTPLVYGDTIKWLTNRSEGLPAYIIISMVTQEVDVVRLENGGMKYSTSEHFGRNLARYLRFKYPTYMFDAATFEIDEDGVPYWISPRIVKRIGLFSGTDIDGAVITNAVTGESAYYDSDSVPTWVDRVYIAELIIQQYDYYGMYQNGWLNSRFGQKNVTVTTDGYNYIAENDDVYMYTGVTSVASDESNVGFLLANQRTKETRYYAIAGAEEYSAMSSAEGVVQQYNYRATFPLLLNIADQPTYFMALKDAAGLVKMYAMVNVQQYQIVAYAPTVAECEKNYIALLSQNGVADGNTTSSAEVTGVIAELRTAVVEGNTRFYIRLDGDDFYYVISAADSAIAAVLDVGDSIKLTVSAQDGELRSAYSVERA